MLWRDFRPSQGYHEYRWFLEFVRNKLSPNPTVLEIGVRKGRQKYFYQNLFNADYRGIDIDISKTDGVDFIQGESCDPRTVDKIKKWLNGRKINLLFIDGDHSYNAVKKDYETYAPLSDIVAFHDICTKNPKHLDVKRYWNELIKDKDKIVEFKFKEPTAKYGATGIGVLL